MHPGEAEILLALAAPYPQHTQAALGGPRGGPVHQGALARSGLSGEHQHAGTVAVERVDQARDPRQFTVPAQEERGGVLLPGLDVTKAARATEFHEVPLPPAAVHVSFCQLGVARPVT
jgi:hypothetical protein